MAQVPTVLRWGGRLLAVAGVVVGMLPDDPCGSAFFPGYSSQDVFTQAVCAGQLASSRQTAVVLLVLGFGVMISGQVLGWRESKSA